MDREKQACLTGLRVLDLSDEAGHLAGRIRELMELLRGPDAD